MGEDNLKYNFVMLTSVHDYYKYMYSEMDTMNNVKMYGDVFDFFSSIERKIYSRCVRKKRENRVCSSPIVNFFFGLILNRIKFEKERPLCFIYYTHYLQEIRNDIVRYIRKKYPDSKHVFFFADPAQVKSETIDFLRSPEVGMDAIGVFDYNMAIKYNIEHWPNIYPHKKESVGNVIYDLCFVGVDKGRKDTIEKIAEECKEKEIKIAFYLKTDDKDKKETNINYIDELMPYRDVVEITQKSKCILELDIPEYHTCTLRMQEAIIFNKKILTNNKEVCSMPYFKDSKNVIFFDDIKEIDWNRVVSNEIGDYAYTGDFSMRKILEKIQTSIML